MLENRFVLGFPAPLCRRRLTDAGGTQYSRTVIAITAMGVAEFHTAARRTATRRLVADANRLIVTLVFYLRIGSLTHINIVPGSLKAIQNEQPGPGRTHALTVTVDAEIEVDWGVKLISATPQGINKQIKLLRFQVHKPTGPHSNAITRKSFRYEESPTHVHYKEAILENDGQNVTVNVAIVV